MGLGIRLVYCTVRSSPPAKLLFHNIISENHMNFEHIFYQNTEFHLILNISYHR